jgi:hypothetical protein
VCLVEVLIVYEQENVSLRQLNCVVLVKFKICVCVRARACACMMLVNM